MSEKGTDSESEQEVPQSSFLLFFENQFFRARKDPIQFTFQVSAWFAAIYIYYIIADEFVRQSLINLTPDRIQDLDLPFMILEEAVDPYTTYITALISLSVIIGVYSLGAGNLTPRQYDIRVQLIALLAACLLYTSPSPRDRG